MSAKLKAVLLALIFFSIVSCLFYWVYPENIGSISDVNSKTEMEGVTASKAPSQKTLRFSTSLSAVTDPADFLVLKEGQKFSLKGNIPNSQILIVLKVENKSVSRDATIISASSDSGLTSIITLTESLTNILVKTANNVFEYSGSEFMGVIDPIRDLNLSEDIHLDEMQEMILLDDAITEIRLEP